VFDVIVPHTLAQSFHVVLAGLWHEEELLLLLLEMRRETLSLALFFYLIYLPELCIIMIIALRGEHLAMAAVADEVGEWRRRSV
jgi:uncharacterized integral membrane protein